MIADRSETWPCASLPVVRFTATVSSSVLTVKTAGVCLSSSDSNPGRHRVFRTPRPGRGFRAGLTHPLASTFFITEPMVANASD
jgi:hypothetical protein